MLHDNSKDSTDLQYVRMANWFVCHWISMSGLRNTAESEKRTVYRFLLRGTCNSFSGNGSWVEI